MSKREENIELAQSVMDCPHKDECSDVGCLFGETVQIGDEQLTHRPSPHIGGNKVDDYCIYVLGQNPGNEIDTQKARVEKTNEYLVTHHWDLQKEYTPGEYVDALGLDWEYIVWENVVRCPTRANKMPAACKSNCEEWTIEQLSILKPDMIILLGAHARDWFNDSFDEDISFGDFELVKALTRSDMVTTLQTFVYSMPHYSYLMRMGRLDEAATNFKYNAYKFLPDEVKV